MKKFLIALIVILFFSESYATNKILPGAEQTTLYFPLIKNKRIAVFSNQSSLIQDVPLVDVLQKKGMHIVKIFAPEHGFRGNNKEGEKIDNTIDLKTGIPIISLYGKKLKPTAEDLKDIDIILFDIQDVGVRFYTYTSSLQYLIEAAIENDKSLIILDRPNPNGFYIDGPVLDRKYKSFIGLQPIPIVYGMTIGEYAKMLIGEQWLEITPKSKIKNWKPIIIPCKYYTHQSLYEPPVKPSPNLPTIQSIYWYPSIGLMENTVMSVGRGTDTPFQVFGHPLLKGKFTFVPRKNSLYQNQTCHGWSLVDNKFNTLRKINRKLQIKYLLKAYYAFPDQKHFFINFPYIWGNNNFIKQVNSGISEQAIRKSWEPQLSEFKKIRKKYLIYPEY